jgi:glycosyltransferase involved in cell wall biosynthesis
MRIAVTLLTAGLNAFGGIERATYFLTRGLVGRGAAVTLVAGTWRGAVEHESEGVRVIRIASLQMAQPTTDDEIRNKIAVHRDAVEDELRRVLRDARPEYMLIIDPIWGMLPLLDLWTAIPCPVGLVFHVCHPADVLGAIARLPIQDLFAVSPSLVDDLRRTCITLDGRTVKILPNCVSLSDFPTATSARKDVILVHARISPEKGIADAVQAFALVSQDISVDLWLCGGTFPFGDVRPTRQEIEETITRLHLAQRVKILPNLHWSAIPRYVQMARLVVIPSYKETFGMAALEAMAAGTPLVVTRAGNLPALARDAALVVEPGDITGLAAAMRRCLTDPSLCNTSAERGRQIVREYDAERVAATLLDHIATRVQRS